MGLNDLIHIANQPDEPILKLLDEVVLGTNGAHYKHLDTREKIVHVDNPIYFTLRRRENILSNITFCERGDHRYVRYFAFSPKFQSSGQKKGGSNRKSALYDLIDNYFDESLNHVDYYYAYIDPNNEKSLWLSQRFGFTELIKLNTQTFSRTKPKRSERYQGGLNWEEVKTNVRSSFSNWTFYIEHYLKQGNFHVLRNSDTEIIAMMMTEKAEWQIDRLPGKFGGLLVKLLPFIPFVRKLIRAKKHSFLVPEAVWVKDNNPKLLTELFESVLVNEKENVMIWWMPKSDELYNWVKDHVNWGLLDRLIGVTDVSVMIRSNKKLELTPPFYTIAYDFI